MVFLLASPLIIFPNFFQFLVFDVVVCDCIRYVTFQAMLVIYRAELKICEINIALK